MVPRISTIMPVHLPASCLPKRYSASSPRQLINSIGSLVDTVENPRSLINGIIQYDSNTLIWLLTHAVKCTGYRIP